jgi:hypothetical protein
MEVPSVPLVPAGAAPRSAGAACSGASSSETRPTSGHCLARPSPYGGCSLARTDSLRKIDAAVAAIVAFERAAWHQTNVVAPWIGRGTRRARRGYGAGRRNNPPHSRSVRVSRLSRSDQPSSLRPIPVGPHPPFYLYGKDEQSHRTRLAAAAANNEVSLPRLEDLRARSRPAGGTSAASTLPSSLRVGGALSKAPTNREPGRRARGPLRPLLHAASAPFRLVGRIAQQTVRLLSGRPFDP